MNFFHENFDAFLLSGRLSLEYGRTAHLYAKRKLEQAVADGDAEAEQFWTVVYMAIRPRGEQSDIVKAALTPINGMSTPVEWKSRLRHVLNTVWDPIGGCPEDEYDSYVEKIADIARDGAPDDILRGYLRWAQVEHMGLPEPEPDRLDGTLKAIRALGPIP